MPPNPPQQQQQQFQLLFMLLLLLLLLLARGISEGFLSCLFVRVYVFCCLLDDCATSLLPLCMAHAYLLLYTYYSVYMHASASILDYCCIGVCLCGALADLQYVLGVYTRQYHEQAWILRRGSPLSRTHRGGRAAAHSQTRQAGRH